jgi:cephalosporin hydroxylase
MASAALSLAKVIRIAALRLAIVDASRSIRHFVSTRPTAADALDFAYGFECAGFDVTIAPVQVRSELASLLAILGTLKPATVVEIGTDSGGTFFIWACTARADALLVSVDRAWGGFGGAHRRCRRKLFPSFAVDSQKIELIYGDSHDPATLRRVRALLDDRSIDFLFLDGDHSYAGVKSDWEMYRPLVRPGGLVALHDIALGRDEAIGEVPRFWAELTQSLDAAGTAYVELIERADQGWGGIGAVYV